MVLPPANVARPTMPWARAVEAELETRRTHIERLDSKRTSTHSTVLALMRKMPRGGSLNYRGPWHFETDTSDLGLVNTGHYFWNFADGIPAGWLHQGVTAGASTYDDNGPYAQFLTPIQPRDGHALVFNATPGNDAYIEIPIPPDRYGIARVTVRFDHDQNAYEYEGNPNPDAKPGPDPTYELAAMPPGGGQGYGDIYQTASGLHYVRFNNATGIGGSGQDTGATGQDLGTIGWLFGIGTTSDPVTANIDTLELAIGPNYFGTAGLLGTPDLFETRRGGSVTIIGDNYAPGDVVSYNEALWMAVTETDGNPPAEGQWTLLAGTAADAFAGEWS